MDYILARQVLRQRAARRLLRFGGGLDRGRHDRRARSDPLGLVGFQRLDRQLELLGLARQPLREAPELGPAIAGQLEAQLGDLRLGRDRVLRHRRNDPPQRLRIVGELIEREKVFCPPRNELHCPTIPDCRSYMPV